MLGKAIVIGLLGLLVASIAVHVAWVSGPGLTYNQLAGNKFDAACQASTFEFYSANVRDGLRGVDQLMRRDARDSDVPWDAVDTHTVQFRWTGFSGLADRADEEARWFSNAQNRFGDINRDLYASKLGVLKNTLGCNNEGTDADATFKLAYQLNYHTAYYRFGTLAWLGWPLLLIIIAERYG